MLTSSPAGNSAQPRQPTKLGYWPLSQSYPYYEDTVVPVYKCGILLLIFLQLLSSSMELISLQPSPFVNLKSLMIYPEKVYKDGQEEEKLTMSTEVKNYLLDGSPSATLRMVSHEVFRPCQYIIYAMLHICSF